MGWGAILSPTTKNAIMAFLSANPRATVQQISDALKIGYETTAEYARMMCSEGSVSREKIDSRTYVLTLILDYQIPPGVAALPSRRVSFDELPPRDHHRGWIREIGGGCTPLGGVD